MKLTIGQRLALGFAAVILLMAISLAVAYFSITTLDSRVTKLVNDDFQTVRAVSDMQNGLNGTLAALRGFLLLGDDAKHSELFKNERLSSWKEIDKAKERLEDAYKDTSDKVDRENFGIVKSNLESLRTTQQNVETAAEESFNQGGEDAELVQAESLLQDQAVPKANEIRDALRKLKQRAVKRVADSRTEMNESATAVKTTLIVTTLIAIFIACLVALFLSRKIASGLQTLLGSVQTVADGDLTQPQLKESADEIGQLAASFNRMTASLKKVLAELKRMTGELGSSSKEISAASQQQVASMTQASSAVSEISSTSEEFKATIQEFADRAKAVREAAEETANRAAEGLTLSESTATRIDEVQETSEAAGESILKLSQQMQQITQITTSVNEIAEQTKLLALNASIEAARAGEEGRGFAVVATQVRELANQSKEASGRIASQISDVQSSVQTVIRNSEAGNEKLTDANEMGEKMAEAFKVIAHAIQQTTDAMKQIDQAAGEQESGIADLVTGIAEINSGSKETLATAEQTQKAIAAIEHRAGELEKLMDKFKT